MEEELLEPTIETYTEVPILTPEVEDAILNINEVLKGTKLYKEELTDYIIANYDIPTEYETIAFDYYKIQESSKTFQVLTVINTLMLICAGLIALKWGFRKWIQ